MNDDTPMPDLSADERSTLDRALDEIIPPSPDGCLPGAGELGISAYVDVASRAMPRVGGMLGRRLAALDGIAARRTGQRFGVASRADRVAMLDELAGGEHAFPPVLILHAYAGYYQHPRVLEALGL